MGATPQPDDLEARLAELQRRIDEIERKTLNNLAVTDRASGVKIIETGTDAVNSNRAFIKMRNSDGSVLFANDTVSGWGYSVPNQNYPAFTFNSWAATQITSAGDQTTYVSTFICNSPRVTVGFICESSGGGGSAGGDFKVAWNVYPSGANPWTQIGVTRSVSGAGFQFARFENTAVFAPSQFGQLVQVRFQAAMTSGIGGGNWVANTPIYVYGSGA